MEKTPLLHVEHLVKTYQAPSDKLFRKPGTVHAVDDVSFDIFEGETLGLVGESGCGKSTVGRQLVGLEKPTGGQVTYRGYTLSKMSEKELRPIRTDLQMVFQDGYSSLNPRKHIRDILASPMLFHKICTPEDVDARVDELLELVGMPKSAKGRYPHEFSGGQRQRIGIARALAVKPKFIVCDEPVSALDVSIQAQILNLLADLQEKLGLSYLFIGHGLATVKYISRRIAVMYMGKIVEIADAEELFFEPLHPYTKALIAAAPIADPEIESFGKATLEGEVGSNVNPPAGCRFHPRCPYATEACREVCPELKDRNGHSVACHLTF